MSSCDHVYIDKKLKAAWPQGNDKEHSTDAFLLASNLRPPRAPLILLGL